MDLWWKVNDALLAERLNTNLQNGISIQEAESRLARYGSNQLKETEGQHPLVLFFSQFQNFIVWVLIAAAVVSGFLQEWIDAVAIGVIVVLNSIDRKSVV